MEKVEKICEYHFTDEERKDIAERISLSIMEKEEKEATKKKTMDGFTTQIKSLELGISSDAARLRDGFEYRGIQCYKDIDRELNVVTYTREDTGEVVEERPMRPDEKQMTVDEV